MSYSPIIFILLKIKKINFSKDKKQISFRAQWFDKYPWLHYEEKADAAFCFTCVSAQNKKIMCSTKADNAFTKDGYTN